MLNKEALQYLLSNTVQGDKMEHSGIWVTPDNSPALILKLLPSDMKNDFEWVSGETKGEKRY